ncbi:aspartate/glutamate racemase family protein [Streptomyces sp. NPDC048278]|uniref:aspartate/glutamate racemase family protein n=1 Tax=unclassified Streptomyces TaxID=2593676 RepID=UPI00341F2619
MSGLSGDRSPTVAVIHATPASIEPARAALADGYPEASVWNVLDDRLGSDAEAAGGLTPTLSDRMLSLIGHAVHGGADGVLLSCSMYGPVLERARRQHWLPLISSDAELFTEVSRRRFDRVLLLGHSVPAVQDSVNRLKRVLSATDGGEQTEVTGHAAPGAVTAAARGDLDALERSLTEAALPYLGEADAVVLGMFSLSPARAGLEKALGLPVLSAPPLAVRSLREQVAAAAHATQDGPR